MALTTVSLGKVLLTHGGTWASGVAYDALVVVVHEGSSYLSILSVPAGTATSNTTYWRPLAKSTYKEWLDLGNTGTVQDFINSMKGDKGDTGATGATGATGDTGAAGADGKTAYQYALDGGYAGTEAQFALDLAYMTQKYGGTFDNDGIITSPYTALNGQDIDNLYAIDYKGFFFVFAGTSSTHHSYLLSTGDHLVSNGANGWSVVPNSVTATVVRSTPLTGFSASNSAITATDTVLQLANKAQGQISDIITKLNASALTANYLPKWDGSKLVNSSINEVANNVLIGYSANPSDYKLAISGTVLVNGVLTAGGGIFNGIVNNPYTYARQTFGRLGEDGDTHIGSSGFGSASDQDYGFYLSYNAFRASADDKWYPSRGSLDAYVFKGGYHADGFSWLYSAVSGTGELTFTQLMKLSKQGNLTATTFTEGATLLSNKYLGINATAADATKIGGQTVSFGANDSAGTGYRTVRVPNI